MSQKRSVAELAVQAAVLLVVLLHGVVAKGPGGECGATWGPCDAAACCSSSGFCGYEDHCNPSTCNAAYSAPGSNCSSTQPRGPAPGQCGARWNATCAAGFCCNQVDGPDSGYCGTGSQYCDVCQPEFSGEGSACAGSLPGPPSSPPIVTDPPRPPSPQPPAPPPQTSAGAIVGACLGGAAALAVLVALVLMRKRLKRCCGGAGRYGGGGGKELPLSSLDHEKLHIASSDHSYDIAALQQFSDQHAHGDAYVLNSSGKSLVQKSLYHSSAGSSWASSAGKRMLSTVGSSSHSDGADPFLAAARANGGSDASWGMDSRGQPASPASIGRSSGGSAAPPYGLPQLQVQDGDFVRIHLQVLPTANGTSVRLWMVPCKLDSLGSTPASSCVLSNELPSQDHPSSNHASSSSPSSSGQADDAGSGVPGVTVDLNIDFERDLAFPLDSFIGSGAFGQVHRAVLRGQVAVAVKVLASFTSASEARSLARELEILSRVDHPNVVKLFGGSTRPLCIVEELMDGSLADLLGGGASDHRRRRLSMRRLLDIMIDVAEGLYELHPAIVHRDLKPANILLSASGVAKIADFGISGCKSQTYLETSNPFKGTVAYLAPECVDQTYALSERADVYSLAIILWECLSGCRPWAGCANHLAIIYQVATLHNRPDLHLLPPDCPPGLRTLIRDMWRKNPRERPGIGDVLKGLKDVRRQLLAGAAAAGRS